MKKIKLTDKEQYILELLSAGLTNPEISAKHNISVNTVKYHLKKIYGILEVKNRVEAAGWYMNHCKNKSKTNPYLKSNTMKNLISLRSLIIVIFITLFYSGTKAQLSGNYTIGKGGDFETFTEASAELNKVGVSGPVTFLVSSGIYEEQFTLGTISGAEPFRPIIFRSETGNPEDALLRFTPTSTDNNYIVHLQGCQFVEFKHLGFEVLDFGRVFLLDFSASHIVIDSCHLSGIFGTSSSVEQALIFSSDPDLENLTLAGNRFSNCGYGTYIQGGFNSPIPGIRILDNTFVNAGYTAVHLNTVENPVITGNIISDGYYGIHITSGLNSLSILKNQVFAKTVGIRVNYHNNQDPGLIANNFIVVEGTGDAYGLDIQNSSNINVYHNSVVIRSGQGGSKAFSCVSNTQGTVNVVNNSFSCMDEGYASYVNYPATIQRSDFNNYYSASNMMFKWGENLYDLPDLKNLSNEDDHSISVYPNHTSDTNLHVHTKWLARKGTFLAEVTDDIDGDLRNTEHPDIGADEFSSGAFFLAPFSGDYPVGPGETYETLQDLIDDLKVRGISSDVVIRLTAGIHDEQAELVTIPGSGPDSYIHITRPLFIPATDSVVISHNASGADDNYILKLTGADFYHIHGITFRAENNTYSNIIDLHGGADSIKISGNTFRAAYHPGNDERKTAITSENGNYHYRLIENNHFYGGAYGIRMRRSLYVYYPEGALINGNDMNNTGYTGIYIQNHHAPVISSNNIEAGSYGILLSQCSGSFRIEKNKLDITSQYGIRLTASEAYLASPASISNNFIHVGGVGKAYGIFVSSTNYLNIDYNSIHITSTNSGDGRGLYSSSGTNIWLRNNIFANTGGGYAYYVMTSSAIGGSDYNDLYTTGTNLAYWDGNHTDLASLQGANSYHQHCLSVDPEFVSQTDLHTEAEALKGAATPLPSIGDDIDGDLRHLSTPDIGADEFSAGGSTLFTELFFENPGFANGNAVWMDYDRDEDLDILVAGSLKTFVYYNQNDHFYEDESLGLIGLSNAQVSWNDFNSDGDPDFLLQGEFEPGFNRGILFENTGGDFSEYATIMGLGMAESVWKDFDNDGDQDLLTTGTTASNLGFTRLYINDTYEFNETPVGVDVKSGSVAAADYDNDGDIDFVLSGLLGEERITYLYRNSNGVFEKTDDYFAGMNIGDLEWGDYDGDGDLDLLVTGMTEMIAGDYTGTSYMTNIYENTESGFVETGQTLRGYIFSDAEWGDYDSDGHLDFLVCGKTYDGLKTFIYHNEGGTFSEVDAKLPGVKEGSVAWGDYDKDGDLDILLCGRAENNIAIARVYTNQSESAGNNPTGPSNLKVTAADKYAIFSWDPGSDNETAAASLTYNLIIGTQIGFQDVITGLVWPDGTRKIVAPGNMELNTGFKINDLYPGTTYYWKVQAIDQSYRTSSFVDGGSFTTLEHIYSLEQFIRSGVKDGDLDFGDYDNDGDLDFILCGMADEERVTEIYTNNDGTFTRMDIELPGVDQADVEWGDYDNDGFLDFILCGRNSSYVTYYGDETGYKTSTYLYRNIGGYTFAEVRSDFTGIRKGVVTWGDCDNDGDLDILLSGCEGEDQLISEIYINKGYNLFEPLNIDLPRYKYVDGAWGDYDNDGDLDFILTGDVSDDGLRTELYKNQGDNHFIPVSFDFIGRKDGSVTWGDYDNDGDLDLLYCGHRYSDSGRGHYCGLYLYKNQGNDHFDLIYMAGTYDSSLEWGDFDNDGDLDILITGNTPHDVFSGIYSNEGNDQFTPVEINIPQVHHGCARWGDWNGDGTLDLVMFGDGSYFVTSYENKLPVKNTRPDPPENLNVSSASDKLILNWDPASDDETFWRGLSYNLKIGTNSGGADIKTPLTDDNGSRKVVRSGNANQVYSWGFKLDDITLAGKNEFYWSVQAIDHGYMGSTFAPEDTIDLSGKITQVIDVPHDQGGRVSIHWQASDLDHSIGYLSYYSIWRAIQSGKKSAGNAIEMRSLTLQNQDNLVRLTQENGMDTYWEWVANQPAHKMPVYSYTCSTVNDSMTGHDGMHTFMISAHTFDPDVFFDSEPLNGYSVDNLSPAAPQNLKLSKKSAGLELTWSPNIETDMKQYLVYRSLSQGINPVKTGPIARVTGTSFTDSKLPEYDDCYYVVCAEDIHGNISGPSNEVMAFLTGILDSQANIPGAFALYPVHPNPSSDHVVVSFDLPAGSQVTLEVFTTEGKKVASLISRHLPAGRHSYTWEVDGSLTGGVYICSLSAGDYKAVTRMVLLKGSHK